MLIWCTCYRLFLLWIGKTLLNGQESAKLKITFNILKTYVFSSEWIGILFKWLRIPVPLIFVMLCMIVLMVLIGVSDGLWAHHCEGRVNIKSWISISKASYSSSLARSPINFTFLQIHFIKSSVNFGRALPEHVSFSRRTRALEENQERNHKYSTKNCQSFNNTSWGVWSLFCRESSSRCYLSLSYILRQVRIYDLTSDRVAQRWDF